MSGGRSRRLAAGAGLPEARIPLHGKSVLLHGAAGSARTAAVQLLAHHFGADATAVSDTTDVELARSLGARTVLDRLRAPKATARVTRKR
jgi:NADPH:quinone reductase-like Zn-dependent oxidoreductase